MYIITNVGRFAFSPKCRKFWLEIKWNGLFRFSQTGILGTTFEGPTFNLTKLLSTVPLFCILLTWTITIRAVAWIGSVQPECTVPHWARGISEIAKRNFCWIESAFNMFYAGSVLWYSCTWLSLKSLSSLYCSENYRTIYNCQQKGRSVSEYQLTPSIFDPQICISFSMFLHRAVVLLWANSTDSCSCSRYCLSRNPEMYLYIKRDITITTLTLWRRKRVSNRLGRWCD